MSVPTYLTQFANQLFVSLGTAQFEKTRDILAGLGDAVLQPMLERYLMVDCPPEESLHLAELIAQRGEAAFELLLGYTYNYEKAIPSRLVWWSYLFTLADSSMVTPELMERFVHSYHNLKGEAAEMALIAIARLDRDDSRGEVKRTIDSRWDDKDASGVARMIMGQQIPRTLAE